ncbi:MAG: SH3 domain-containing protein [Anaerolineae bacterium]|nr:SH3 domain-containing protein [Anaerolineae bacterium]
MLNRLRIPFLLILSLAVGLSGVAAQSATLPGALGEASGLLAFAGVEADQFSTEPTEPGLVAVYGVELPETEATVLYDGELLDDALAVNCLVWSLDGAVLFISAQTADGERVIALDIETGEAAETTEEIGCDAEFTPSPDGERRAFYIPDTVTDRVRVVVSDNADDATTSPVFEDAGATTSPTTWSPDNRFIGFSAALRDADGNITGLEIALVEPGVTGGFLNEVDTLTAYAPAWQPDGSAVVVEPTEEPVATEEVTEEPVATETATEEATEEPVATEEATEEATATATPTEEIVATEEATEEAVATATPTEEIAATEEATEEAAATATPTEEIAATEEATEEATATATPTEEAVATEEAAEEPTEEPTVEPTVEAVAEGVTVTVPREVIVRSGPTALYAEVARLPADTTVPVVGISEDLAWLLLELPDGSEAWIATAPILVFEGDLNSVPTVTGVPTITPAPPTETPTLAPTETPAPTNTPTVTPTPTPIPVTKADTDLLTELFSQDFTEDADGVILLRGNPWERALVEGNEAFCNLRTDTTVSPGDVIYWGNEQWDDYVVELRVRFEQPVIVELYSRFNLRGTLYSAYVNAPSQTAQFTAFTPDGNTPLGSTDAKFTPGEWYTLRVELEGDLVRYWLDDTLIVEGEQALGIEAGFAGVRMTSGQQVCIDDINVWALSSALSQTSAVSKAETSATALMFEQDFTNDNIGVTRRAGGSWEVVNINGDDAYCNRPNPSAQAGSGDVIVWGREQWDDYIVELDVRFVDAVSIAEVYTRFAAPADLFSSYLNGTNQAATLAYFGEGVDSPVLSNTNFNFAPDTWYTVRVELNGDHVRYWLDDRLVGDDSSVSTWSPGVAGFRAASQSAVCIDNITVWSYTVPLGAATATVNAASANLRGGPGTGFAAVGALVRDEELIAVGRSSNGEWVQVRTRYGTQGWVSTPLVDLEGEFEALPVVEQQN